MIQHWAALVITGAIKGTSRDRLYQEIGPESLADRRWFRKIFFFHKIVNGLLPSYLQSYLNHCNDCQNKMKTLSRRTKTCNPSFYPYSINSIQDGLFRGYSRMREQKGPPLPKICHKYPTMMKLGTVIPYLKKIQKIYESRDTRNRDIDCTLIHNF